MKRLILLSFLALALVAWVNCSNPLEPDDDGPNLVVHDTIYQEIVETLVVEGDTLIDTLIDTITDTLTDTLTDTMTDTITDTVTDTLTDTVTVTVTDTVLVPFGDTYTICSIIHYNLNELIWIFDNEAGRHQLVFDATVSREFDAREIIIDIDGDITKWPVPANSSLAIEADLIEGATIRIYPDVPLFLGHQVDICLAMEKL